jgi:Mrp family chromosome partitioning ATPase
VNATTDNLSLERVRRVLRRRRWVVLACVLAGAAAGVLLGVLDPRGSEATATVLIESGSGGAVAPGALTAQAAARLVQTRGVAQRVAREMPGGRSTEALLGAVSAEADDSGSFVTVTADDEDAAAAARIANAFANQFIATRSESVAARVREAIEAGERQLSDLEGDRAQRSLLREQLAEQRAAATLRGIDAQVIDPAVPGPEQGGAATVPSAAVGAGLGLLIGLVLAFTLESLDPRVRALGELRALVRAPQLAALPRRSRARRRPPVLAARREPFEHLRGALLALNDESRLRRLAVTSPGDRNEDRSAVVASLAVSLATTGLRVCAVDADLRRPRLASQFGLDVGATGLAEVLRGAPLEDAIQRFPVPTEEWRNGDAPQEGAQLSVLAAGQEATGTVALVAGERMEATVEQLGRDHDIVIFACAPLLAASDALGLVERASGTILVVGHSHTPRRSVVVAERAVDARGSLLGVVATRVPKAELAAEGYGPWPSSAAPEPAHGR